MTVSQTLQTLLALAPVLLFLASLLYIDSYKLVRLSRILQLVAAGAAAAVASYLVNMGIMEVTLVSRATMTGIVAPVVEEILKFIPLLLLFRAKRIGFVIDAAICGFAAGAGFALVENLYYLAAMPGHGVPLWLVRGFGTALMHGGVTAIAAMLTKMLFQRNDSIAFHLAVPGLLVAIAIHALFNLFLLSPLLSAVAVTAVLPPLIVVVFALSERQLQAWLGSGFDIDAALLEAIQSADFASSRPGRYLDELRQRFDGPIVADMLCYLRLHSELSLRAKGILMLRENGLPVQRDSETPARIAELRYLRSSIGPTGQLALAPLVHRSSYDLWQLQLLEEDRFEVRGSR